MNNPISLFEINPALDKANLRKLFAKNGRVQIRDLLTAESAHTIHRILMQDTPWGFGWQAAGNGPNALRAEEAAQIQPADQQAMSQAINQAMQANEYGFIFGQYRMLDAYLEKWAPGSPHDLLLEHINSEPFLSLIQDITGDDSLIKADAQATLYAPGHFLAQHDDSHVAEGWKFAYVLNMCAVEWRPDWGGFLNFFDENGDIEQGFRPRFNCLNLFRVPQKHNVSYVPPFAPVGRFAITGWFRDN